MDLHLWLATNNGYNYIFTKLGNYVFFVLTIVTQDEIDEELVADIHATLAQSSLVDLQLVQDAYRYNLIVSGNLFSLSTHGAQIRRPEPDDFFFILPHLTFER